MHKMKCPLCKDGMFFGKPCLLCNGTQIYTWTEREEREFMRDVEAINQGDEQHWRFGAQVAKV